VLRCRNIEELLSDKLLSPRRGYFMSSHRRNEVTKRVARIHGHVHGILEMLEQGRSYAEVVQQISAVKAGLDSAVQVIVEDLVEDCVAKSHGNKSINEPVLELKEVIARTK
jgi:DNA-binding FrmR family transcriptional regulator